jgi:hypothetical protein
VRGCSAKSSSYLAFEQIFVEFQLVVTLMTASAAWSGGADAVLLEQAPEPEELAVRRGELLFELADRCPPAVAFAAEFLGEDVHDVAAVRALGGWIRGGTVFLLVPEHPDARAEVVVAVEEIEAGPGGAGDGPEADVLLVLDERTDRGLGAGNGGLPLGLGGLSQRGGSALAGAAPPGSSRWRSPASTRSWRH